MEGWHRGTEVSKVGSSGLVLPFSVARRVLPVTTVQGFYTLMHTNPSSPEGLAENPASFTLVPAFDLGPGRSSCRFGFLKGRWEYLDVLSCVEGGGGWGLRLPCSLRKQSSNSARV